MRRDTNATRARRYLEEAELKLSLRTTAYRHIQPIRTKPSTLCGSDRVSQRQQGDPRVSALSQHRIRLLSPVEPLSGESLCPTS